jgi:hypothetical protein
MAGERQHRDYRSWLLSQPCCCQPCTGAVVIHHHTAGETEPHAKSLGGRRGKGQRASDDQGMPLCFKHHGNLHELRGYFAGWHKHQLRDWQTAQVERLQRLYAMAYPAPLAADPQLKPGRPGAGWTVAGVLDLLRKEATHRPAEVSAALKEIIAVIEERVF